jgi:hypothetical protein
LSRVRCRNLLLERGTHDNWALPPEKVFIRPRSTGAHKRRAILGALGASVVSTGVLGSSSDGTDDRTLAERFGCTTASRPACDGGSQCDDGTTAYPDPPATASEADTVDYARRHERTYARNRYRCSDLSPARSHERDLSFGEVDSLEWDDGIHVVRLQYVETATGDNETSPTTVERYGGAVYAGLVDGVTRVTAPAKPSDPIPNEAEVPDPVESGTLVDCF